MIRTCPRRRTLIPAGVRRIGHASRDPIALTVALLIVAAAPAMAADPADRGARPDRASPQETVGVTTGVVLGAVVGGPVGAIAGGAAGGWLGDRYHREHLQRVRLDAELAHSETERRRLAQEAMERSASEPRYEELGLELHFRSGDSELQEGGIEPLMKLGALAAALPDAQLHIEGFADPRGSAARNQALSEARARSVAVVLAAAGLAPERMLIEAHGAECSTSAQGDLDGYALERRVSVRLERQADGARTAAR